MVIGSSGRTERINGLYLAVLIDLCTRKVVDWSMSSRMKAQLVCNALQMAIWRRQPKAGLIHHSDRGSQCASKAFRQLLKAHGIEGSMSHMADQYAHAGQGPRYTPARLQAGSLVQCRTGAQVRWCRLLRQVKFYPRRYWPRSSLVIRTRTRRAS